MRRIHRGIVAALASLALAGCGGSASEATTIVPPVDTGTLGTALDKLRAAGLRAQIDEFVPLPAGYTLASAAVGDQDPEGGTRVPRGSIVRLDMHGANPIPSVAVPKDHPKWAVVPNVVGLPEPVAETQILGPFWPRITRIAPLPPEKSKRGLDAFVVASQSPPPGTRMPYRGQLTKRGFRVSVVRLALEVR